MNKYLKEMYWLFRQSFRLDIKLFQVSDWHFSFKLQFLLIKYLVIIKHFFIKFRLGRDNVEINNRKIFYDTKYGVAGLEATLTRHRHLLKIAKVDKVKNIIDIGANVGYFTILAKEMYPLSKIFCFEPIAQTYECLVKNTYYYTNISTFNVAISNKKGYAKMLFDEYNSAISAINRGGNIRVATNTLDNIIQNENISTIDILKIDTESFEENVLLGARKALEKTRYLFIEITIANNSNYSISSLMSLLYSSKFNFQLVAYRNFGDTDEGEMPAMDCLLKNLNYK